MHALSWQLGYAGILPEAVLMSLDPREMAKQSAETAANPDNGSSRLVAERDGAIVGFVVYGPNRDDADLGQIYALYVHPDHWGTGVADELIKAAFQALPQSEVRLWVLAENPRARRFYEKHGMRFDGTTKPWRPKDWDTDFPIVRYVITRGN